MPNWVSTNMSVTGSKEELERFASGIKNNCILESYVPCPEELRETVSGFYSDEDKMEELRKKGEENIAKYGHKDWYEWQYAVWGTKWGDCETHLEPVMESANGLYEISGYFQTAWGPASAGFLKISAMFPTLRFLFDHDEEAGFFAGLEVMEGGKVIFDKNFVPSDYDGELDWEDDESIDKYEQWKDDESEKIWNEYYKIRKQSVS